MIRLLDADLVLMHSMVQPELACGTPPAPRAQTLRDLGLIKPTQQVILPDVLDSIERELLHGLGCGLVDMVLLASTLITPGAELWTRDERLASASDRFGVMHHPAAH